MTGSELVVVIGSGVIGSSIAYHLARQGRQVLVIERSSPAVEPAASWASAGGVRRQGRDPAEALLAIESIARWPSLTEELGADLGYHGGGNLYVGEGDQEAELVARFVEHHHAVARHGKAGRARAHGMRQAVGLLTIMPFSVWP